MTPSPSDRGDAWADHIARALFADLNGRGHVFAVAQGRLVVRPAAGLTDDERAAIRAHADSLRVLVLVCDDRCLDRVIAWRRLGAPPDQAGRPGRCVLCAEPVPHDRARCAWCALASRVHAGAVLPPDLLYLFGPPIAAPSSASTAPAAGLPFDVAALADAATMPA